MARGAFRSLRIVPVTTFDHKPERCPFGHSLWSGMAQFAGNPASAHLHRNEPSGDISGCCAMPVTTSPWRRCSISRRTTSSIISRSAVTERDHSRTRHPACRSRLVVDVRYARCCVAGSSIAGPDAGVIGISGTRTSAPLTARPADLHRSQRTQLGLGELRGLSVLSIHNHPRGYAVPGTDSHPI